MSSQTGKLRLIHVSDIHFWQYALNPPQLFSKRLLGMASLLVRRARRFRLERVQDVVERVIGLKPDHILITGDLTTTALPAEFRAAKRALAPWLDVPGQVTVIPGNHDRYTVERIAIVASRSSSASLRRHRRIPGFAGSTLRPRSSDWTPRERP